MSACTEYAMYKYDVHATIHGAIKDGNIEDLRQLLQDDDHFITYAFLKAIESMQVDMIRFLLEGYDVDVNQYNGAALIDSARCGNLEVVDLLLAHDADVTIGENGALEVAVENGHAAVVDFLLESGADNNNTMIRIAISKGHTDVVRVLLEYGANANAPNVLLWAVQAKNTDMIKMLLDHGATLEELNDALISSANSGDVEAVKIALAHGADPNAFSGFPLRSVAFYNYVDVCRVLLEKGADPNRNNPLRIACCWASFDVARMLLQHGADPTVHDNESIRVIVEEEFFEDLDFIAMMLSYGADGSILPEDVYSQACERLVDTKPARVC